MQAALLAKLGEETRYEIYKITSCIPIKLDVYCINIIDSVGNEIR